MILNHGGRMEIRCGDRVLRPVSGTQNGVARRPRHDGIRRRLVLDGHTVVWDGVHWNFRFE